MEGDSHRVEHLNKLKDLSVDLTAYMTSQQPPPVSEELQVISPITSSNLWVEFVQSLRIGSETGMIVLQLLFQKKTVCYGYSLESPEWGDPVEHWTEDRFLSNHCIRFCHHIVCGYKGFYTWCILDIIVGIFPYLKLRSYLLSDQSAIVICRSFKNFLTIIYFLCCSICKYFFWKSYAQAVFHFKQCKPGADDAFCVFQSRSKLFVEVSFGENCALMN